jgi:hypothetical protein
LQRFASEDPIGLGGGQINLYGYVGNSPTRFSDPRGLTSLAVKLVGKLAGGVSVSLLRFYDPRSSTSLPVQILDRGINLAADVFTTGDDSACGGIYDGAPRDTSKRKPPNYSSPLSRRCHEHDVELAGRGTSFRDPGNFDINLHLGFGAWRAGQHVFGAFFVLGGLAQGAWELANVGELLDYISDVWTEISPD